MRPSGSAASPQQERSRRSHQRMIDVARELLVERGHQGVTVAEVSRRAEVAVGTLYGRFGDKSGLLHAVHEAETDEIVHEAVTALTAVADDELGVDEAVGAAVMAVVAVFRVRTAVMRELFLLSAGDAVLQERGRVVSSKIAETFRHAVLAHTTERSESALLVADMCYRTVFAACAYRTTYGPDSESSRPVSWDQLAAELSQMCAAYARAALGGR